MNVYLTIEKFKFPEFFVSFCSETYIVRFLFKNLRINMHKAVYSAATFSGLEGRSLVINSLHIVKVLSGTSGPGTQQVTRRRKVYIRNENVHNLKIQLFTKCF